MNNSEIKNRLLTEEHHDFESLCLLVSLLRSEDGCRGIAFRRIPRYAKTL